MVPGFWRGLSKLSGIAVDRVKERSDASVTGDMIDGIWFAGSSVRYDAEDVSGGRVVSYTSSHH